MQSMWALFQGRFLSLRGSTFPSLGFLEISSLEKLLADERFAHSLSGAAFDTARSSRPGSTCRPTCCSPNATAASTCPMCCPAMKSTATMLTIAACSGACAKDGTSSIPPWPCVGKRRRAKAGCRFRGPESAAGQRVRPAGLLAHD